MREALWPWGYGSNLHIKLPQKCTHWMVENGASPNQHGCYKIMVIHDDLMIWGYPRDLGNLYLRNVAGSLVFEVWTRPKFFSKTWCFFVGRIIFQQSLWKSWRQRSRCWAICKGSALRTEVYKSSDRSLCICKYMCLFFKYTICTNMICSITTIWYIYIYIYVYF